MTLKLLFAALAVLACTGFSSPAAIEYVLRPVMRGGE